MISDKLRKRVDDIRKETLRDALLKPSTTKFSKWCCSCPSQCCGVNCECWDCRGIPRSLFSFREDDLHD